jgi:hypothetical protein
MDVEKEAAVERIEMQIWQGTEQALYATRLK